LLRIRKQSAPEEAEEHEPKERAMTVSESTEGLGITEAGIKVFEYTYSKELRAATTRQASMGMLACYEEILKKK
jgi:hypothetical protein